tara:strand:+ start:289 stop:564 length:276 start_codon:yes stop_codon:yes gene_type:complete
MSTELKTPIQTKTVKMSLDQYAVNRVAITSYTDSLKEKEVFWLDRLNGSNNEHEVKDNQFWLKETRIQIRELEDLVKIMDKTELITEHKLY